MERERDRETETETERERQRQRQRGRDGLIVYYHCWTLAEVELPSLFVCIARKSLYSHFLTIDTHKQKLYMLNESLSSLPPSLPPSLSLSFRLLV